MVSTMTILAITNQAETSEFFLGAFGSFWGLIAWFYRARDKEKTENYALAVAEVIEDSEATI
jgi:hypothetical protein